MKWKQQIKEIWEREKWIWAAATIVGLVFSLIFGAYWSKGYSQMVQNGIAAKVVRFHVLANSDSSVDQALKLAVRDRVLAEFGVRMERCASKEETLRVLMLSRDEIGGIAAEEIREQGYDYPVRVSVVREEFPLKRYDTLTFPAGVYDALRIEIGEAKGQNWWCVLYPRMCFVDASLGDTVEESYQRLENTLTEEEYLVVSAMGQEELMPKLKLKLLELWE